MQSGVCQCTYQPNPNLIQYYGASCSLTAKRPVFYLGNFTARAGQRLTITPAVQLDPLARPASWRLLKVSFEFGLNAPGILDSDSPFRTLTVNNATGDIVWANPISIAQPVWGKQAATAPSATRVQSADSPRVVVLLRPRQ